MCVRADLICLCSSCLCARRNSLRRVFKAQLCADISVFSIIKIFTCLRLHQTRGCWSNERDTPTLTKIDRILVPVDWDLGHPDKLLQALSSSVSDHAPLHLITTRSMHFCPKKRFRFELYWTKLEGFDEAIKDAWVCLGVR